MQVKFPVPFPNEKRNKIDSNTSHITGKINLQLSKLRSTTAFSSDFPCNAKFYENTGAGSQERGGASVAEVLRRIG